jgi:hypothetical protein
MTQDPPATLDEPDTDAEVIGKLHAEIERLRNKWAASCYAELEADNERLRAALEPFARNVKAVSLMEALGHIGREHLLDACAALEEP